MRAGNDIHVQYFLPFTGNPMKILIRLPIDTWVNCHPVSVGGGGWEGLFGYTHSITNRYMGQLSSCVGWGRGGGGRVGRIVWFYQ